MRRTRAKRRLRLGVSAAAVAAVVATGAFGGSGGGTITTIAGTGKIGLFRGRRPGDLGAAGHPTGVAVDGQGNVYIADYGNSRVRKVSPGGTITTIRRHGQGGLFRGRRPGDLGAAEQPGGGGGGRARKRLHRRPRQQPRPQGEPRRDDHDRRRQGARASRGDGGPATSAQLNDPMGWRWTGRATSTSPTATTSASAR